MLGRVFLYQSTNLFYIGFEWEKSFTARNFGQAMLLELIYGKRIESIGEFVG